MTQDEKEKAVRVGLDPDTLERLKFDPAIDYLALCDQYSAALDQKRTEEAKKILYQVGGFMALCYLRTACRIWRGDCR